MSDVKWIKIVTDIFDDEKILLIESLPEADSIIVIWFKLLCLAGKQNNSGVFTLNGKIPYTDKMFATIFRRKESVVQLALQTFVNFGMIEIIENTIIIPNWGKHQTLDKIESRNEYMRNYMTQYRSRQLCKVNSKVNSKVNVNSAELDSKEIDNKEIDKDIKDIVEYLNEKAGTSYKHTTQKTKTLINARLKEKFTVEDFHTVIDKKTAEWIGTEQEKYLRPETLFGTKFESYLNQKNGKPKSTFEILQAEYEKEVNNEQNRNHQITGSN